MIMKLLCLICLVFILCGCPKASAQTPVTLGPVPKAQFLSNTGAPLAGGKVYTYIAGTSTQLATFTDSTGTVQNSNPIVLDSAGRANIWFSSAAYKIVVKTSGGVTIYTVDNFLVQPFLAADNAWTGNQTFAGTSTFNGAVTFSGGGAMSGSFSGSPTFSGNPTFSGTPTFSGIPLFSNALDANIINGTITSGGLLEIDGADGATTHDGQSIELLAGNAGPSGATTGGSITLAAGIGGSTGGDGGDIQIQAGQAATLNASAGAVLINGVVGAGTGHGSDVTIFGGIGGGTAGRGGNINVNAGTGGAGGVGGNLDLIGGDPGAGGTYGYVQIGGHGTLQYNVPASLNSPSCSSTGIGGAGTCTVASYSSDSDGRITLTPAAGVGATGTVTLTFHQSMGANGSFCQWNLDNAGSGTWDAQATFFGGSGGSTTATMTWVNNSMNLTAASIYGIDYKCTGRP